MTDRKPIFPGVFVDAREDFCQNAGIFSNWDYAEAGFSCRITY